MYRPPADAYKNPQRPATALQVLLGVTTATLVFDAWASLHRAAVVDRILDGRIVTLQQADQADRYVFVAAGLFLAAFVPTGIVWLVWFHRSYKNVVALGSHSLRFSSGWAIGSWFVPLLNIFRPKQIANDLFGATAAPGDPRSVPAKLHVWWTSLLVSAGVARAASATGVTDARKMATGDRWSAVGDVAMIVAGLLAIVIVRELTARQIARHADRAVDMAPAGPADLLAASATGPVYTAPPIAF